MTAIMFVKICVLVMQIRASLLFVVPPIGEIEENNFQLDAINHRPLLPKADAKGVDNTYDAMFTGTKIEQLQNKWLDLDVPFPKLKQDSINLEMKRWLSKERGKKRLLGLPISHEHNILVKDSNSEASKGEELFHSKDRGMEADDSMAANFGQEYSDEPEMMSHDQLGDSDVCPIVQTTMDSEKPPPGVKPEELDEYKKRAELQKTLSRPTKPTLLKVKPTFVQVKWTIKLSADYPVQYFVVQYREKKNGKIIKEDTVAHDPAKVPAPEYFHDFVDLHKGHSYQFTPVAVYKVPDDLSVGGESSDWIDIE